MKQEKNESKCPELIKLRQVVEDKNETEDRRWKAAFCYTMIALALNTEGHYEPNLII